MKYRIVVTYVEAGMGHIVSADAIADALEKYYPDKVEVLRYPFYTATDDEVLKNHEKYLVNEVKSSNRHPRHLWHLFFWQHIMPPQATIEISYAAAFASVKHKALEILKDLDCDMILSTHFEPLFLSCKAKKKYGKKYLTAAYDPDPNVHAWWDRRSDLFIVNNENALDEAVNTVGFDKDKCRLSRFILRNKVLEAPLDKAAYREKFGIDRDAFTVVMADGAYASANLKTYAEALLSLDAEFTLAIVAGKNDEIYEHFSTLADTGKVKVKTFGFLTDIHELYCAADLFVTKAGPNAILDSVYMQTPVMTDFWSGPIELCTKELFVDKYGLGLHAETPEQAAEAVGRFVADPSLLDGYRENCKRFRERGTGEKEAADAIVRALDENAARNAASGTDEAQE